MKSMNLSAYLRVPVVYDSFQESLEPLSKSVPLQEINDPYVVYALIGAQSNVFSPIR